MVNFNGDIVAKNSFFLNQENRGLRYGDALFETIRVVNGEVFLWEDHYLRLMASMRILRMEIPMNFTLEFLKDQIVKTVTANGLEKSPSRVRLTVFRKDGGLYMPETREVSYIIEAKELATPFYTFNDNAYEVELFKDFTVNSDMLSTLKTSNKLVNVLANIYAKENDYVNCLLINNAKQIVEATNGNIFLVKNNIVKTPPLSDGCLNGIIRKKLIEILKKHDDYQLEEASISPFDLQKADELFITNTVVGIQSITKYRKKQFENTLAKDLIGKLNMAVRLEQTKSN